MNLEKINAFFKTNPNPGWEYMFVNTGIGDERIWKSFSNSTRATCLQEDEDDVPLFFVSGMFSNSSDLLKLLSDKNYILEVMLIGDDASQILLFEVEFEHVEFSLVLTIKI